jgi:hypothetical protein
LIKSLPLKSKPIGGVRKDNNGGDLCAGNAKGGGEGKTALLHSLQVIALWIAELIINYLMV